MGMGNSDVSRNRTVFNKEGLRAYRNILLFEIQCREGMSINSFCQQLSKVEIEETDIIEKKNKKELISHNIGYSYKTAKRYLDGKNKARGDYEWFFRAGAKVLEIDEVVMFNLIEDYLEIEKQAPVTLELYQEKVRPNIEEYKRLYENAKEQAFSQTKLGQDYLLLSKLIEEQPIYIIFRIVALYNVFYNFTPQMQAFFEAYMKMLKKNPANWNVTTADDESFEEINDKNVTTADDKSFEEINNKIDNIRDYEASKIDYIYLFILKNMLSLSLNKLKIYYDKLCKQEDFKYFENQITTEDFKNKKLNTSWLGCILDYYSLLPPEEQNKFFYLAVKFTFIKDKQSVVEFVQTYPNVV